MTRVPTQAIHPAGGRNLVSLDLGSSGGRLHLAELTEAGSIAIEEVHRFENGPVQLAGRWYWDFLRLWQGIGEALVAVAPRLDGPATLGIESFGVDYALLDQSRTMVAGLRHMRDPRTQSLFDTVYATISKPQLYRRTGAMEIEINTLLQLIADRRDQPWLLNLAQDLFLTPDYVAFLLTGLRVGEVSIASTTQLVNPVTRNWDFELAGLFDIPRRIFPELVESGTVIGPLLAAERERLGISVPFDVVAVASHDTASAAAAIPYLDDAPSAFISLGTWSLVGRELDRPDLSDASREFNFTNECGAGGTVVHHKIQAGLWLTQELRRELARRDSGLSFKALEQAAEASEPLAFVFDADDGVFRDPASMAGAIRGWFEARGHAAPATSGALARSIYDSLALSYRDTVVEMERLGGVALDTLYVVGGGAAIPLLLQAIADATGKRVVAGPVEATVAGNVIAQLVARGVLPDFAAGRPLVRKSFQVKEYQPSDTEAWNRAYARLAALKRFLSSSSVAA
ncbi:L-fuculose kinase [Kaistia sp. 32K]|uniref:rhamnulokinase n=1 Tax=Kaistia sp. 32K TaxID=2795690 RepID=UPI00191552AB|nr:rhamnulokinase family protein [Kaistia sp. 32K]BCP54851.1 L-fuculose kinase [Kaistia sp. 32K]